MKIRLMTIEDYPKVRSLWDETAGVGLNSVDDSQEGITGYLLRNPSTCFVAEENGELVGVILCGHDGRRGYIYHTAVSGGSRRIGVGKALVESAVEALRKEHISKVALVAFTENQIGNAFWEKLGFTKREDLTYRNLSLHPEVR